MNASICNHIFLVFFNSGESSGENSECKVIYEFPSDDESENDSRPAQAYGLFSHTSLHTSAYNENRASIEMEEQKNIPIKVFDTNNLNRETTDATCAAGTSGETERKRKKDSISLLQNKRQKEAQNSSDPMITDIVESSDSTTDGFADMEDKVKDSSSSENCEWNSQVKQMPGMVSRFQHRNARQNESVNGDKSMKVNHERSSSSSDSPQNNKSVDKTAEKTLFPSSLKGETLPLFVLSDENKEKFKLSMPTILEVRESESDELISEQGQSKTNSLKMKSKVGKRKDRCNVCNARLGLCAIQCRCGGYYCAIHRYDREHNCTYDYKSMGAAEIQKNNPRIVAEKIRKL